jgi:hypothetical protein
LLADLVDDLPPDLPRALSHFVTFRY